VTSLIQLAIPYIQQPTSYNFRCCGKPSHSLTFSRNQREDSPTLTWSSLQHLLENAIPHVLIILDCCFAANAARDITEGTTKEILAACGRENPTLGVGVRSFTFALIEELRDFGNKFFTVAMLHSRLVTMRWRLAFTPVYALLSESGGNSIHLAPLALSEPSITKFPEQSVTSSSGYHLLDSMDTTSNNPSSSSPRLDVTKNTRVLLAVSLAETGSVDAAQWTRWLTTGAPGNVTGIGVRLECAFESHSTLAIVSIPTYAWARLPEKPGYYFVGFIKSENLVSKTQEDLKDARRLEKAEKVERLEGIKDLEDLKKRYSRDELAGPDDTNVTLQELVNLVSILMEGIEKCKSSPLTGDLGLRYLVLSCLG